jgi:hypothetical protein
MTALDAFEVALLGRAAARLEVAGSACTLPFDPDSAIDPVRPVLSQIFEEGDLTQPLDLPNGLDASLRNLVPPASAPLRKLIARSAGFDAADELSDRTHVGAICPVP